MSLQHGQHTTLLVALELRACSVPLSDADHAVDANTCPATVYTPQHNVRPIRHLCCPMQQLLSVGGGGGLCRS